MSGFSAYAEYLPRTGMTGFVVTASFASHFVMKVLAPTPTSATSFAITADGPRGGVILWLSRASMGRILETKEDPIDRGQLERLREHILSVLNQPISEA